MINHLFHILEDLHNLWQLLVFIDFCIFVILFVSDGYLEYFSLGISSVHAYKIWQNLTDYLSVIGGRLTTNIDYNKYTQHSKYRLLLINSWFGIMSRVIIITRDYILLMNLPYNSQLKGGGVYQCAKIASSSNKADVNDANVNRCGLIQGRFSG